MVFDTSARKALELAQRVFLALSQSKDGAPRTSWHILPLNLKYSCMPIFNHPYRRSSVRPLSSCYRFDFQIVLFGIYDTLPRGSLSLRARIVGRCGAFRPWERIAAALFALVRARGGGGGSARERQASASLCLPHCISVSNFTPSLHPFVFISLCCVHREKIIRGCC